MKKKNKFNYATTREHFFDESELEDDAGYFRINNGDSPIKLNAPNSIMYRLYRLGQAYGFRQLRFLESGVKIIIGSTELSDFKNDLESVHRLVNDEVLRTYIEELLNGLASCAGKNNVSVSVSIGEYY